MDSASLFPIFTINFNFKWCSQGEYMHSMPVQLQLKGENKPWHSPKATWVIFCCLTKSPSKSFEGCLNNMMRIFSSKLCSTFGHFSDYKENHQCKLWSWKGKGGIKVKMQVSGKRINVLPAECVMSSQKYSPMTGKSVPPT